MRKSVWYFYSVAVWLFAVAEAVLALFLGANHKLCGLVTCLILLGWGVLMYTANRENLTRYEILLAHSDNFIKMCKSCVVYGILIFFLGMFLLRNGGPHIHEGAYCLWNHGFIREITEGEYRALSRVEGSMFAGLHLFFSTVTMAFFTGREKIRYIKYHQDKECKNDAI